MTYYSALHYAAKAEAAATTATTLLPYITDISTVAASITNVNTVAGSITGVNSVAADLTNINAVASDLTNIDAVAGDLTNIDAVNTNKTNIDTVAGSIANVNTVAGDITNVNAVAGDLTNINAVAADLTNIDNASTYAAEAKQWAIGDPTEPVGSSAKYWAQQAAGQAIPSQTGHSGEYLTTDGSSMSWNAVDALPSQTGHSGEYLTTDGSTASWATASVTVDQVYDSTSANAQSGVAINGAGFLKNTATGANALTIDGTATTATSAVNIGKTSTAGGGYSTALGYYAASNGSRSTSIGYGARIGGSAPDAIQIGNGTNSTGKTFCVGFYNTGNYQLLDGSTGIIPYQRINAITDSNLGGQLKSWTGTKAEYDAIVTKDVNTLYNITDDTDVSLTILETLYPIGSIYITTNSSCPLSTLIAGSTWVLVGQDRVLQGAGTRGVVGTILNESLPNITGYAPTNYWAALADESPNNCCTTSEYSKTATLLATGSIATNNWKIDASRSSSTYQDNAPVQPDAYLVNIYRRIS